MQSLVEIADDFTALVAAGKPQDAAEKYWAQNVTSIEPANLPNGNPAVVTGFAAALKELVRWMKDNTMEDILVDGPFITGEHFALFIDMEIIRRATGKREPFSEIAIYTVRGDKITEERHFHG